MRQRQCVKPVIPKRVRDRLTVAVYVALSLIFAYLIFSGIRIAYEYVCAGGIEP
jgi:hypothetical protein